MEITGNILIIDDEASLRHGLTRILKLAHFDVTTAEDGRQALSLVNASNYDLVYLDIRLPDMDGLLVLKEIRKRYPDLPVILLTAYGSLQTALEALHLGATDYLLKPIDPEVLVARTRIILEEQSIERRRREIREEITSLQNELRTLETGNLPTAPSLPVPTPGERFLKRASLILDMQTHRATFQDKVISLPPAAFDYLVVLARHSPETLSYQTLVTEAQGYRANPDEARELTKWHIHALRQVLEPDPEHPRYLLNIRGVGYRLVVD